MKKAEMKDEIKKEDSLYAEMQNIEKKEFEKEKLDEDLDKEKTLNKENNLEFTKYELDLIKSLEIKQPEEVKKERKKEVFFQIISLIFCLLVILLVIFFYIREEKINIWYIRSLEIVGAIGIIYLSEMIYKRTNVYPEISGKFVKGDEYLGTKYEYIKDPVESLKNKKMFLGVSEILILTLILLFTTEVLVVNKLASYSLLLIFAICCIIYYIVKAIYFERRVYFKYLKSRSDVRDILKKEK